MVKRKNFKKAANKKAAKKYKWKCMKIVHTGTQALPEKCKEAGESSSDRKSRRNLRRSAVTISNYESEVEWTRFQREISSYSGLTDSTQIPSFNSDSEVFTGFFSGPQPLKKEVHGSRLTPEIEPFSISNNRSSPATALIIEKSTDGFSAGKDIKVGRIFRSKSKWFDIENSSSFDYVKNKKSVILKVLKLFFMPVKLAHDFSQKTCPALTPFVFGMTVTFVLFLFMYFYKF